jgi:hypothetical protein
MPECFFQGFNPAHLLFGLSLLFEFGLSPPGRFHVAKLDRIAFFKCTEPIHYKSSWPWAEAIINATLSSLQKGEIMSKMTNTSLLSPERGEGTEQLYCFDKLYYTRRWGTLFSNRESLKAFQRSAKTKYGSSITSMDKNSTTISERCRAQSLRILFLIRGDSSFPRAMKNMGDVTNAARKATRTPILIEKTRKSSSLEDQWRLFNSFDILISSTGSHMANMILTENPNVGFIEVGIVMRDAFWQENALYMGFKSYKR